jgi:hypothetical protein
MNQTSPKPRSTPEDHLIAFELYLAMGTGRSIKKLVEAIRVQTGTVHKYKKLEAWSSRHGWQARIIEAERESEAAGVAEYIAGAPLATAKALQAIGSVMNLAESLMLKASANREIEIKSVDDLAKVGKLINNAAKLAEVLNGRPDARAEFVATGVPGVHRSPEKLAIDGALAKLNERGITDLDGNPVQHIGNPAVNDHGRVIDAIFTEANQPVSDPGVRMDIRQLFSSTADDPPDG